MKIKMLKFPDGRVGATTGLKVEINKQKPILEEEVELSKTEVKKIIENPKKFKFKNAIL